MTHAMESANYDLRVERGDLLTRATWVGGPHAPVSLYQENAEGADRAHVMLGSVAQEEALLKILLQRHDARIKAGR